MPRIYVACLASYNNGTLHGAWIDADQDADAIREAIAAMLKASKEPGTEEWAIHDYEGFAGIKLSESHDIDDVAALAELIEEHGEEMVEAAGEHTSESDADALRIAIEDDYAGTYDSEEAYAEEMVSQCVDIDKLPDLIRYHIDWDGIARDMRLGGDVDFICKGGSVYVFHNH